MTPDEDVLSAAGTPLTVENLKRVQVQPGDIFVLPVDRATTPEQAHAICEVWRRVFSEDVRLLIVPGYLEHYRPAGHQDAAAFDAGGEQR